MGHGHLTETPLPLDDWYAVEEREREIAVLRERRKKQHEKTASPPTTLINAMSHSHMISSREIRALVEVAYKNVVISLYLHLSPEKLVPNAKGLVRSFHSLKSSVAEKRQEFIRLLPREQKRVMSNDMAEIEAFLGDYPVPKGMRSLVIFKSGAALNRVISLPVRSNDKLVIDPDPYVTPLEATLEENERVLAVEVSKERSEFFVYHLGYFQKVDRIKSFVPKDSVDASIPGRVQRHRLTHLQWHLKLTARKCSRLYNDWSCRALVLMGEQRVSHLLEEFLHETLKESIIGRIYGSHKADDGNAKAEIEKELRTYKEQREVEAVRELTDYNPDVVAAGLHDVIEICNLFLARRLFISDGLHQQGFVCRAHHYVSLDERQCPFCRAALMPVENVIDEILEIARMHGVNVTMIEYRQDLMSKYDGIAGVTYAPVHRN